MTDIMPDSGWNFGIVLSRALQWPMAEKAGVERPDKDNTRGQCQGGWVQLQFWGVAGKWDWKLGGYTVPQATYRAHLQRSKRAAVIETRLWNQLPSEGFRQRLAILEGLSTGWLNKQLLQTVPR